MSFGDIMDYAMFGTILLLMVAFSFTTGVLVETFDFSEKVKDKLTDKPLEIGENKSSICNNMSLSETSFCLRDWMRGFYNYTLRNELQYKGDQGTFEDIKKNGGDCHDYSLIYKEMMINRGFLVEPVSFYKSELNEDGYRGGHEFLIVYDLNLTGYCRMDMMNVDCVSFDRGL